MDGKVKEKLRQWNLEEFVENFEIDAEFKLIFDERKGDSFCSEFGIVSNSIILQARHCGRSAAEEFANRLELDLSTAEPCNEKIFCALILLPMLLPQGVFRKSGSKISKHMKIKPTGTQSLDHFIQFLPVGQGIEKFMKEDRLLGGDRKQPFVLAIEEKLNPVQTFFIFENHCIETSSMLKGFRYNGTTYLKNMVVFVSCIDELTIFGKIKKNVCP